MDVRIQHMDLTLSLANHNRHAHLENDIKKRFTERVLNPLSESLDKIPDASIDTYLFNSIDIEEEIFSLASLNHHFDKIRTRIEQEIKRSIASPTTKKVAKRGKGEKLDKQEIVVRYILFGELLPSAVKEGWRTVTQELRIDTIWQKLLTAEVPITSTIGIRFMEIFSFKEFIEFASRKILAADKIEKAINEFWTIKKKNTVAPAPNSIKKVVKSSFKDVNQVTPLKGKEFRLALFLLVAKEDGALVSKEDLNGYKTDKKSHSRKEQKNNEHSRKAKQAIGQKKSDLKKLVPKSAEFRINNAGLFMLHPFLPQLFKQQNVLNNGEIVNVEKALQLLSYLATGEKSSPKNFDLETEKILLGLQTADTYLFKLKLKKSVRKECDELLEAVIKHWGVLGNTSPKGLRELFIAREGVAKRVDANWTIEIERKAQDILLDKLPWGVGVIKLPWIEGMIIVKFAKI